MSIKLRDLIRAVRACKTAAEERAVISKECALIRTAIREEDEQYRHRNVAKLMYIHMLGYPTHFGQMECLKLISAVTFPEKRIGYLGLTLLLTEQTEVLTLVTNSLKLDLTNSNQYIQALSLIAIGNLSTQDMARDLASDVERILKSNNAYLRKKAALATIRLLKKEPDLIEHMSDKIVALLKDRAHGVLVTGLQLMIDILDLQPEMTTEYQKLVPSLVRLLRNFISMGFSPEHDVGGITDPFMQVKLLNLLRRLGKGNDEASDQMNDVLAQVATNTETSKNAGNAILYECVQTIMEVESDSGLRVLAVNILGRFLLNRDNNIRYVALNSLSKVVSEDIAAVQRHRNTIVDCLKDADVSIRQRALELIYQLVNDQNVTALTTELLNYLVVAQTEHKTNLVSKITQIVESYSPNPKWRVDTIITMLSLSGNFAEESVHRTAVLFLAQSKGLQGYSTHRLYRALQEDTSQQTLLHVGIWCIGEFGNYLVRDCGPSETYPDIPVYPAVSEDDVLDMLDKCTKLHNSEISTKALVLNALMKLSVRLSAASRVKITSLIAPFQSSMSLELQQRSTEYAMLLSSRWDNIRGELLGSMPVLDDAALRRRRAVIDEEGEASGTTNGLASSDFGIGSLSIGSTLPAVGAASKSSGGTSLIDLDDIFGMGTATAPQPQAAPSSSTGQNLLADIFSTPNATPLAPMPATSMLAPQFPGSMPVMPPQAPLAPTPTVGVLTINAFEKAGLQLILEVSKPAPENPSMSKIFCKFNNFTPTPMESFVFQAAVPKYLKLEMLPPSGTSLPGNSTAGITQEIRVVNSMQGEKNIMLKLKIKYNQGSASVEELVQVSSFPNLY